jgi:hypothetical protein
MQTTNYKREKNMHRRHKYCLNFFCEDTEKTLDNLEARVQYNFCIASSCERQRFSLFMRGGCSREVKFIVDVYFGKKYFCCCEEVIAVKRVAM